MNSTNMTSVVSSPKNKSIPSSGKFPIVGIGASAGGLEALELFLSNVPSNSNMAYIVIQHLDPTQKGMLPELLQRVSEMEVIQVKDCMMVRRNCVYVIPPNKSMSILRGMLYLFEPEETRGVRHPIDVFFRSLADDSMNLGVGVILSGMGSDGSIGFRALKDKNAIVMVQEPSSAKFDSMPRSAISAVQVDIIAPACELPVKLIDFMKQIHPFKSTIDVEIKDPGSIEKIIVLLRAHTGNDFSSYKKNTMYRRIERRMGVYRMDKMSSYVSFLQENPKELDILFKELLIGVTNFFRDAKVWEALKGSVIPDMIANTKTGSVLRAWIPGCSTGEEAYSLAIVFKEALEGINSRNGYSLQIFATDLDAEAVEIARKGFYPTSIANDVSTNRLNRFFISSDDGYRVNAEIREMVVFAHHNIIMHPPFTKLDILTCRNLLIYLDAELQKKIMRLFFYSLKPNAVMVLGSAETLGQQSSLFSPIDSKLKIYKRNMNSSLPEMFDFPSSFSQKISGKIEKDMTSKSTQSIQTLADQMLLQHFSPPGVLVNENGDIIYTSGRTGKYLEPSVGKANMNIFAMLRDGLRIEFPSAFRRAIMNKEVVVLTNMQVVVNGEEQLTQVTIQWIDKPEPMHGLLMIVFMDLPPASKFLGIKRGVQKKIVSSIRQSVLEDELQHSREAMQNTLDDMQISQEELKSTNEELQSTNEELQSTNEELTTSKEEMQSLNEELQTVNAELQSKVDDYTRVSNDMKNLLNSTDIATLFLDKDLNIRRYTIEATKIFKLIKSDIGRPFTDLVTSLVYPALADDSREVLRSLIFIQKQILATDGRWFSIRIMPYRTFEDRIDGLVITFVNTSDIKQLEEKFHETGQMHRLLLNSSSDIVVNLSTEWNILEFNPAAEKFFGIKHQKAVSKNYIKLLVPEAMREKTKKELDILLKDLSDRMLKMQVVIAGGGTPVVEWSAHVLLNDLKMPTGMILIAKTPTGHE